MIDITTCNLLCTTWYGQMILLGVTALTIYQEYRWQKLGKIKRIRIKK